LVSNGILNSKTVYRKDAKTFLPPRRQERQEEQKRKTFNVLIGFLGGLGALAVNAFVVAVKAF
jgi:hypothetical protein